MIVNKLEVAILNTNYVPYKSKLTVKYWTVFQVVEAMISQLLKLSSSVQERRMENSDCPWKTLMDVRKV